MPWYFVGIAEVNSTIYLPFVGRCHLASELIFMRGKISECLGVIEISRFTYIVLKAIVYIISVSMLCL